MAEVNPPYALQNRNDHSAQGDRYMVRSLLGGYSGKLAITSMPITQRSTPTMGITVGAGACFVAGTESAIQGMYHCHNDGPVDLPVDASSSTQNRKDIVIAEVLDAFYSGTQNLWRLRVVKGTPASGTAAEPAVPQSATKLGTIDIPAGATQLTSANIVNSGAIAGGRPIVAASSAEISSVFPQLGQELLRTDTGAAARLHHNGSSWQLSEGVVVQATDPGHQAGRLWLRTTDSILFQSVGGVWRSISNTLNPEAVHYTDYISTAGKVANGTVLKTNFAWDAWPVQSIVICDIVGVAGFAGAGGNVGIRWEIGNPALLYRGDIQPATPTCDAARWATIANKLIAVIPANTGSSSLGFYANHTLADGSYYRLMWHYRRVPTNLEPLI